MIASDNKAVNGSLAIQYTGNPKDPNSHTRFVNIKPALTLSDGKVCFSFPMKGTSGKDVFDIYIDADLFNLWMEDIKSGRMFKILKQEADAGEKYAKHYKFATGEKLCKNLGISNSRNGGYLISAKDKEKTANIPISLDWLRILANHWEPIYQAFLKDMARSLMEYEKNRQEYFRSQNDLIQQDETAAQNEESKVTVQKLSVTTTGASEDKKGYLKVPVQTNGNDYVMWIDQDARNALGDSQLNSIKSTIGISINATFEVKGKNLKLLS